MRLRTRSQRAAVSVPANIAEGCGENTDAELARYFQIAMGSSSELEYLFLLAHDLGYIPDKSYTTLNANLIEVRKMLNAFLQTLRARR